uniref:Uncharacterized protein n=1 Tax=Caenorhabditis tropicalis TaxID=1561998 RepID=A0A1I7V3M1_9PELO
MKFPQFLLFAVLVVSGESDEGVGVDQVKNLCTGEQTCYAYPENCKLHRCHLIFSYGPNNSSLLVGDLDDDGYALINIEKNGERTEDVFLCFASGNCFYGTEEKNQTYTVQKKQKTESFFLISRDYAQYLFTFPRVVAQTGPEIGYSFRLGTAGDDAVNAPSKKLYHMDTSKPAAKNENNVTGTDVKNIVSAYQDFDKLDDDRRRGGVRSKKSPEEIKTVSFDEFYADRMIFSNAINELDIDEKKDSKQDF